VIFGVVLEIGYPRYHPLNHPKAISSENFVNNSAKTNESTEQTASKVQNINFLIISFTEPQGVVKWH